MKNLLTACLLALLLHTTATAQSTTNPDEQPEFDGVKIVGEKEVSAKIAVTKIPEEYAAFESAGFAKYTSAFGVHIFGTADARDEKLIHAANIIAEYHDNDRNGVPDNMWLLTNMLSRNATILMPRTNAGFGDIDRSKLRSTGHRTQGLWDEESRPGFVNEDGSVNQDVQQDAALEEIWHLFCSAGYSKAYPKAFDPTEDANSKLNNCMDKARGGHFTEIPEGGPKKGYPAEAIYYYTDETCSYRCMAVEYMYWSTTSLLDVQEFNYLNRRGDTNGEWDAYNPQRMRELDPCMTDLLTNAKYRIPTEIPDGRYVPAATPTIKVSLIEVEQRRRR